MLRFFRSFVLVGVLGLVLGLVSESQAAACSLALGNQVILAAGSIDPNVFVWDNRIMLLEYADRGWIFTKSAYRHALLEPVGTHAIVTACHTRELRMRASRYFQDSIGVKIISGPDRGRYGWAAAEDVHLLP